MEPSSAAAALSHGGRPLSHRTLVLEDGEGASAPIVAKACIGEPHARFWDAEVSGMARLSCEKICGLDCGICYLLSSLALDMQLAEGT